MPIPIDCQSAADAVTAAQNDVWDANQDVLAAVTADERRIATHAYQKAVAALNQAKSQLAACIASHNPAVDLELRLLDLAGVSTPTPQLFGSAGQILETGPASNTTVHFNSSGATVPGPVAIVLRDLSTGSPTGGTLYRSGSLAALPTKFMSVFVPVASVTDFGNAALTSMIGVVPVPSTIAGHAVSAATPASISLFVGTGGSNATLAMSPTITVLVPLLFITVAMPFVYSLPLLIAPATSPTDVSSIVTVTAPGPGSLGATGSSVNATLFRMFNGGSPLPDVEVGLRAAAVTAVNTAINSGIRARITPVVPRQPPPANLTISCRAASVTVTGGAVATLHLPLSAGAADADIW